MFGVFARLARLETKVGRLQQDKESIMSLIDDLRAAVAADAAADKAVLDYLVVLKGSVDDLSKKLADALAAPAVDAAAVQDVINQLQAHSADMASHVPAPAAPVDVPPAA